MRKKAIDNLIDDTGQNRAVCMFLALYGNETEVSVARMQAHLEDCGFGNCSPEWVATEQGILKITRAREWIRHLFELEEAVALGPWIK